jgi:hypothetical protein
VKLLKLFLLMVLLGGAGGVIGSMAGNALGKGGVLAGGVIGGTALVIVAGLLSVRWAWIKPPQRLWTIVGAVFGFALACMVTLSTLSSPVAPMLSTLLIGSGAVLGAVVGRSPHGET